MNIERVFAPIDIAVSGLRAQGKQMEVISSNIANARTVDAGKGEPYRRLDAIFKSSEEGISGVELEQISTDNSEFPKLWDPGNPKAVNGYVSMPNVQLPTEIMNLTAASRAYQANTAVLKRYQKMVETTLELLR